MYNRVTSCSLNFILTVVLLFHIVMGITVLVFLTNLFSLNGTLNGRKVWRHESRQVYIYFWNWGVNSGQEWMVGHSPGSAVRGIRDHRETKIKTF